MKDFSRNITMHCPICGNDQFTSLDCELEDILDAPSDIRLQCSDCKAILTKEELIEENKEAISDNVEEIQQEVVKEIEKELKKAFKRLR